MRRPFDLRCLPFVRFEHIEAHADDNTEVTPHIIEYRR